MTTTNGAELIRITRGGYTYELSEIVENEIFVYDADGNCAELIAGQPGDWQKILDGADPVADGWENGNGTLLRDALDMDTFVDRLAARFSAEGYATPSRAEILEYIYMVNETARQPYNNASDDSDISTLAEEMIDAMNLRAEEEPEEADE